MANVMELLRKIKTAIYGRDVRQSIYDAILQCYQDATGNPESIAAHTGDTNNPHNVTAEQVGLAPVDGVTLSILDGYIKSIVTASGLKTKDTNGLLGQANAEVMLQALMDELTNRVVNQILTKSMLINNGLTTESGKYALDAAFGKTLADKDAELASSIAQLNSDIQITEVSVSNVDNIDIIQNGSFCVWKIVIFNLRITVKSKIESGYGGYYYFGLPKGKKTAYNDTSGVILSNTGNIIGGFIINMSDGSVYVRYSSSVDANTQLIFSAVYIKE